MENLFFGFFIDIWCSLHQSYSHRLLNVSFSGSIPCLRCCSQYSSYNDFALARNSLYGNLAFHVDLTPMKYSKSAFLTSTALFGATAPSTLNLPATSFPSILNYPVSRSFSQCPTNLTQILKPELLLSLSFMSVNISHTVTRRLFVYVIFFFEFRIT